MASQQFFGALLAALAVLVGYLAFKQRLGNVWSAITGGAATPANALNPSVTVPSIPTDIIGGPGVTTPFGTQIPAPASTSSSSTTTGSTANTNLAGSSTITRLRRITNITFAGSNGKRAMLASTNQAPASAGSGAGGTRPQFHRG